MSAHLGWRGHFAGEVVIVGVGILLDEVIVGDVEVEGAAAGDEAVHLRERFEKSGFNCIKFYVFGATASEIMILNSPGKTCDAATPN